MIILYTVFQLISIIADKRVSLGPVIVQLIVVCICPFIYSFLIWKIYLEIRWRILMKFEDNTFMRAIYKRYQFFITVLKFDTSLNAVLLAGLIIFIWGKGNTIYVLSPCFCVLSLGGAVAAFFAVKYEKTPFTFFFLLILLAQPIYLLYKLIKLSVQGPDPDEQADALHNSKLAFYWIAGIFGLVARVVLIIITVIVQRSFGKGLKEKLMPAEPPPRAVRLSMSTRRSIRNSVREGEVDLHKELPPTVL